MTLHNLIYWILRTAQRVSVCCVCLAWVSGLAHTVSLSRFLSCQNLHTKTSLSAKHNHHKISTHTAPPTIPLTTQDPRLRHPQYHNTALDTREYAHLYRALKLAGRSAASHTSFRRRSFIKARSPPQPSSPIARPPPPHRTRRLHPPSP